MGKVPSSPWNDPIIDGSGKIITACRGKLLHTWFYSCKFEINRWNGLLGEIGQRYYEMNCQVTLKVDLEVFNLLGRGKYDSAGIIKKGEKATIVKTDERSWCLIRSEKGLEGWFPVMSHSLLPTVGMWSGEVFDGLSFAD